jgi:flagellar biosynthesis protein FlhG
MFESGQDQATGLRELFEPPAGLAVLPLTSARRGMGYRSLVASMAAAIARSGQRVIVLDIAAKGVAPSLGVRTPHDLSSLLSGEKAFEDVVVKSAEGPYLLKAQSGIADFIKSAGDTEQLFLGFRRLAEPFDTLVLAGHGCDIAALVDAGDDLALITSPDSSALTATYAEIKRARVEHEHLSFRVVVNRVDGESEGLAAFNRLADTARKFLGVSIEYGGSVTRDAAFVAADRAQCSVHRVAPESGAALQIAKLVQYMQAWRIGRYALKED